VFFSDTKTVLNSYIRAKSALWSKTTFVHTPVYFENYLTYDQKFYPMLGGPKKVSSTSNESNAAMLTKQGSRESGIGVHGVVPRGWDRELAHVFCGRCRQGSGSYLR
jgi:hypothetical protein